eukprot:gene3626-14206_t
MLVKEMGEYTSIYAGAKLIISFNEGYTIFDEILFRNPRIGDAVTSDCIISTDEDGNRNIYVADEVVATV